MSLIFDMAAFSAGCRGKLWLGSEAAASNLQLLHENKISIVLPCATKPYVAQSMDLRTLPVLDGTAVANGEVPFDRIMSTIDTVIEALAAGKGVLICCRNGAHRSATLTAMTLLRLLGKEVSEETIHMFMNAARNIVDLESSAPPNKYRATSARPIDYICGISDRVRALPPFSGLVPLAAPNELVTPMGFRRKCLGLGFQTTRDVPEQRSRRPSSGTSAEESGLEAGSGSSGRRKLLIPIAGGDTSAVESFEMVSEQEPLSSALEEEYEEVQVEMSDTDMFVSLADELANPETRREKIRALMEDLQTLDARLMLGVQHEQASASSAGALGAGEAKLQPVKEEVSEEHAAPEGQPKSAFLCCHLQCILVAFVLVLMDLWQVATG